MSCLGNASHHFVTTANVAAGAQMMLSKLTPQSTLHSLPLNMSSIKIETPPLNQNKPISLRERMDNDGA